MSEITAAMVWLPKQLKPVARYIESYNYADGRVIVEVVLPKGVSNFTKFADHEAAQAFLTGLNAQPDDFVCAPGFDVPGNLLATPATSS